MKKRCKKCKFKEGNHSTVCSDYKKPRRNVFFSEKKRTGVSSTIAKLLSRVVACVVVILILILGFYVSLIVTSDPLSAGQSAEVEQAINVLEKRGFTGEVFYLRNFTTFRRNDNWLNASVAKENAYAATNYPFEIITIYPDFYTYTKDEVERAAILLHEAKHLEGLDEPAAYEFVWKNKKQLGWTKEKYRKSIVWREIRKQTREFAPKLFVCDFNDFNDCTE